jgi:hypothetical protein
MRDRLKVGRFFANPIQESRDARMSGQQCDGIKLAFERFFIEQRMHLVMAGLAKPGHALLDFFAGKSAFIVFV